MGYIGEGNDFAKLIANNIYSQVSAIVELVANFYDEDATNVKIEFKESVDSSGNEYITEIKIIGNGNGFDFESLNKINEIGNSYKKKELYSKIFKRIKLGSFGIALASFRILGNELEIHSKNKESGILYRKIEIFDDIPSFTDVIRNKECAVEYDSGCTLIIKKCKILKSIFSKYEKDLNKYDLLKNKLAYLPLQDNFKMYLQNGEIERFIISNEKYTEDIRFSIDEIVFTGTLNCCKSTIDNKHFRGVYLKIDGRIIDWNIFNEIRFGIKSPGSVETRLNGYIEANGLRDKINASRNGLTDNNLLQNITSNVKRKISDIKSKSYNYFDNMDKITNVDKNAVDEIVSDSLKNENNKHLRIDEGNKKILKPNEWLENIGIKFCYEPTDENEVIFITAQLCQMEFLDFNIIELSRVGTDSIIMINGEKAFLEFEYALGNFFIHNHSHNDVDYILCWDIKDKTELKKCIDSYLKKYSGYIKKIKYSEEKSEVVFEATNGECHIVKVYILEKIIKNLCC